MCDHRLWIREVGGGFAIGQDTDLLVRMRGHHVIQAEIHTCPTCRYSGFPDDFASRSFSPSVKEAFFREISPRIECYLRETSQEASSSAPLSHVQYYLAALMGNSIGLDAFDVGVRFLRAYWCLRLPPAVQLSEASLRRLRKLYLRESVSRLRHRLHSQQNRVVVYLVGELSRRNSNFGLATQYLQRYLYRERDLRK